MKSSVLPKAQCLLFASPLIKGGLTEILAVRLIISRHLEVWIWYLMVDMTCFLPVLNGYLVTWPEEPKMTSLRITECRTWVIQYRSHGGSLFLALFLCYYVQRSKTDQSSEIFEDMLMLPTQNMCWKLLQLAWEGGIWTVMQLKPSFKTIDWISRQSTYNYLIGISNVNVLYRAFSGIEQLHPWAIWENTLLYCYTGCCAVLKHIWYISICD